MLALAFLGNFSNLFMRTKYSNQFLYLHVSGFMHVFFNTNFTIFLAILTIIYVSIVNF